MRSIEDYINERMAMADMEEYYERTNTRFSVTVDNVLNFRLEYLAKILGQTRAGLASDFLSIAVTEAEKKLGISIAEKESDYGKAFVEFWSKNNPTSNDF